MASEDQPLGKLAQQLLDHGYSFDFVSDRQLAAARVEQGQVVTPGGTYRVICEMPAYSPWAAPSASEGRS